MADSKQPNSSSKNVRKEPTSDELKAYFDLMSEEGLEELEVREGDFYLRLSRSKGDPQVTMVPVSAGHPAPAPAAGVPTASKKDAPAPDEDSQYHSITTPLAGTFYRSPSPQSPSFVKEGDKVAFGDVLCIIEAMKVMNEIRADRASVVRKILIENNKPVTASQKLFLVEPI